MAECKVVGNDPITIPALTGGFTTGRKITFTTPSGTVGIVKVTDQQVGDGSWKTMIQTECDKLESINRLGQ